MLYLIAANRAGTLAADDAVVPAAAVVPLREAAAVLVAVGAMQDDVARACAAQVADASARGFAAGEAAGRDAAAAGAADRLFDLDRRAAAARRTMRADIARLALEVVRRIASTLGDAAAVAALAERAAYELAPDTVAVVRVAPGAVDAAAARLAAYSGLTVVGDGALGATDCVIETTLGTNHAGLEVQLAAVERAWGANAAVDGAADRQHAH